MVQILRPTRQNRSLWRLLPRQSPGIVLKTKSKATGAKE